MMDNQVNFKLRYMLACTDEEFNSRVVDKVERRQRFESGIVSSADHLSDDSLESEEAFNLSEEASEFSDSESSTLSLDGIELGCAET